MISPHRPTHRIQLIPDSPIQNQIIMSTMTSTRPGTPYPYTYPSPPPLWHRTSSTPLHFHIPTLPSRTPPSLLKRTSSTSSPKHLPTTPTMPSLSERRSSSSSSSCSSSSPTTPKLLPIMDNVQVEDLNISPTPYSTEQIKSKVVVGRPPLYRGLAVPLPPKVEAPRRPKMIRRDTPRPKTEGGLLGMQTLRQ